MNKGKKIPHQYIDYSYIPMPYISFIIFIADSAVTKKPNKHHTDTQLKSGLLSSLR